MEGSSSWRWHLVARLRRSRSPSCRALRRSSFVIQILLVPRGVGPSRVWSGLPEEQTQDESKGEEKGAGSPGTAGTIPVFSCSKVSHL